MSKFKAFYKKYQMIIFTVLAVLVCGGASLFGYYYLVRVENSLWNQLILDLTEVTYQGGHAFETYASQEEEIVGKLTESMAESNFESDREKALNLFKSYALGDGLFSLVTYDDNGGTIYLSDREEYLTKEECDYLLKGLDDKGISTYLNYYTGQLTLGHYQKFTFADGTKAVLRKGQLMEYLRSEFSLSFYNETGFSYITDLDGNILIRPDHKNSNRTAVNLNDLLKQSGGSDAEISRLFQLMQENTRGAIRLASEDRERVLAFVPLEGVGYLISIIPNSSIMNDIDNVLQTTQTLTIIILLIFIIGIVFALATYFFRRKIMAGEREVKYREQLFSLLANNTDDIYLLMSLGDFSLEYVSPNSQRVLGVTQKDIQQEIETDSSLLEKLKSLTLIPEGGSMSEKCDRVHRTSGELKHFTDTVYRTTIDNAEKLIIILSDRTVDVQSETALKEAMENAKTANRAKSVFLSNMSHDIRTPMNAIIGFTELIKRDAESPEKVREYVNKISASGQHLLGLINDILDMSKIENGKVVLNIQKFNLAEFVDELGTMMRPQAEKKNQTFEMRVHGLKQENLLGDKLRLNQILINILSNAIKYTPDGGAIQMDISELERTNENFARLRFTIADNGIGMSDEYRENLFKPFTREISSTVNSIQGTGLGMAITKNLVDLMSGTITVKSKRGVGSTFIVELELRIDDGDVNNEFWEEVGITRTLVVDDDEDICRSVASSLADAGMDASYALNGRDAIALVEERHAKGEDFDLILIDLKMPGMNGIETAEKIRSTVSKDISIVMLTAYDWNEIENEAKQAGIDCFLPKPFFVSNLKLNIRAMKKSKEDVKEAPKNPLEGKHFLAAEDNALNAEILVELLDIHSATCEIAENGKIALDIFEKSESGYFDGILMDIQMPVMNGLEAASAIRNSSHPDAKTIPIIAMTANAFSEDINNSLDAGMNAHIAKPVDMEKLEKVYKEITSK